jgi:hypothetical protein
MFLLFKKIYFQLVNSLKIIMCLLTFILLVSLLRTSPRAKFFSKGLLSMVCIPCLICCLHLLLLSPSLVPVLLSLNGTIALVILPFVQQVVARHKLPLSSNKAPVLCSACQQAKSHGLLFARSTSRTFSPLEIIHSDVWGPTPVSSIDGFCYYVSFLDDFSKFCWFIPIIAKFEVYEKFLIFQRTVERLFSCKIKSFQSDWGGEYRKLNTLFNNIGMHHTSHFLSSYPSTK